MLDGNVSVAFIIGEPIQLVTQLLLDKGIDPLPVISGVNFSAPTGKILLVKFFEFQDPFVAVLDCPLTTQEVGRFTFTQLEHYVRWAIVNSL